MLQNIVSSIEIQHYYKNIFCSDMIQIPPLVHKTYHLIMSYKLGTFNV